MTRRAGQRRIGILAGGGALPVEIAEGLSRRGAQLHIVALEGEAGSELDGFSPSWANWGQIGRIVASFKQAGCCEVVIAGSVKRPDLATIKPDLGLFRALPTVIGLFRVGGDDAILRGVIGYLESLGLSIVGVGDVVPELLVGAGRYAGPEHRAGDLADAQIGFDFLAALAPFDIGQAVVVADGRIETVEGAEGTDRMLDRLTGARHLRMHTGERIEQGVLVKAPKPGQELRVDMPVIGPGTIQKAAGADLKGIAVAAGQVLAVGRGELQELAETHRIFVTGVKMPGPSKVRGTPADDFGVRQLGRRSLGAMDKRDALKAAAVVTAGAPFGAASSVVVQRRHVLAVDAGEGPVAVIRRAGELRQWGGGSLLSGRRGIAVVSAGRDVDKDVLDAADAAGLAGVGVVLQKFTASVSEDVIADADRRKLFIAALAAEG